MTVALHYALLMGPIKVKVDNCLVISIKSASLAVIFIPIGADFFKKGQQHDTGKAHEEHCDCKKS
jgi:hypothetical protein